MLFKIKKKNLVGSISKKNIKACLELVSDLKISRMHVILFQNVKNNRHKHGSWLSEW